MKQRPRPIHKKLELETYAHDQVVTFLPFNRTPEQCKDFVSVKVPVPLMYRLYHLGRAYDLPRIVALHPTGSTLLDFIQVQVLALELELISGIVDDPALQHHIDSVLELIKQTRGETKMGMLVKAN